MNLPLSGIKVVDFSEHGFVPSGAAALGDWGADVVKIERLEGDPMRSVIRNGLSPAADGVDYLFELANRNKRGIALDVTGPAGRAVFERLVQWADVYITNQLPRVRRKLRTEPDDLFALNPKLVFAKGHGQGQRGDDAEAGGFDSVSFWSRGGMGHMLTDPDAAKLVGQRPALGDVPSGMFLAGGVCAGLVHVAADRKGMRGRHVAAQLGDVDARPRHGLQLDHRARDAARQPGRGHDVAARRRAPHEGLALAHAEHARRGAVLGADLPRASALPELIDRYPTAEERRPHWPEFVPMFAARIEGVTRDELEPRLRAEGCIFSFFASPPEVLADQAVIDNGYAMADPVHPKLRLAAAPVQFDDAACLRCAAPRRHRASTPPKFSAELGFGDDEIDALFADGVIAGPRPHA